MHKRIKAVVNAPCTASGLCADANLHPRKVAQIVVRVGPPIRITIFRVVVAIGKSSRFTDEYAAEIEGGPTALRPMPRRNRAHTSIVITSP
jgi:hypothetical protein